MQHSRLLRTITLTALPALALATVVLGLPSTAQATVAAPSSEVPQAPSRPISSAATAVPAGPGTIVYIKGYDVYVARPDGSGERRLTWSGTSAYPWVTPSGADNGTIAAARGNVVYRMDQWGTILNSFDPPNMIDSADVPIGGRIKHAAISPDGSKIAYTYEHFSAPRTNNQPWRLRWVTAVSAASYFTTYNRYGVSYSTNPSWMTNSRMVLNDVAQQITTFELATFTRDWFADYQPNAAEQQNLFEPTVSRDGTLFASVRGEGAEQHIGISAIGTNVLTGPAPQGVASWPQLFCATHQASGFASPTFAPDSSGLAWQDPAGVWVLSNPKDCADQEELAIPGAKSPHWAKAGLQSKRPTYRMSSKAKPRVRYSGSVRVGKRLSATVGSWNTTPTRISYRWLRNGKSIKGATKSKYKVTRKDRGKRISVRVTVSRPYFAAAARTSSSVKVRR